MGNEDFYLNDKLVSVHLYYMEEYDKYVWVNEYYKEKLFIGKRKYRNPKVVFIYVNGDKRTYYFDNNSDAEKFYTNFKAKYKENEYLIFN